MANTTPIWQIEQALRTLDKEIAEKVERREKLVALLAARKEA